MSSSAESSADGYDGRTASELAALLGVPRVETFASVTSTLDVAHRIAPSVPAGTLVVADEQSAGRGTQGRRWLSGPGDGVWLALLERVADASALDVLSIRCGLYAAEALDGLAAQPIGVKWPNDLYVGGRKLAGILIETRWRSAGGHLTADELSRWKTRDVARGRLVSAPSPGTVEGVAPAGELLIRSADGAVAVHRTGTLTFAEPLACS